MAKVRETKIEADVQGYNQQESWRTPGDMPVEVLITGTGPKGNLKGIALVYSTKGGYYSQDGVAFSGVERYSFMYGGSTFHHDSELAGQVRTIAKQAAAEWKAANPSALYEFRVKLQTGKVVHAEGQLQSAIELVANRTQVLEEERNAMIALLKEGK